VRTVLAWQVCIHPPSRGVHSFWEPNLTFLPAATQWLFNFVITKVTPSAINSIGWRTFLMFAIFCLAMAVFVWVFVPETKQLTLEEIDLVFGVVDAETRAKDIENAIEIEKSKAGVDYEEGDEKIVPKA
jgi:hypothetical protein